MKRMGNPNEETDKHDSPQVERLLAQRRVREARYDLLTLGPPPARPVRTPISEALEAEREER
jgi:hypothetical protein